jgi:hypothetical protein
MKLTKQVIKQFEEEQKDYGTRAALFNIIWQVAGQLMKDLGVKGISTKGYVGDKIKKCKRHITGNLGRCIVCGKK